MIETLLLLIGVAVVAAALIALVKCVRIVPQQKMVIVERLGKYSRTLEPGFHLLWPVIDRAHRPHDLREVTVDIEKQNCFTKDNVSVAIDGVLYYKVLDPKKAQYGHEDFRTGIKQLAQTSMRAEIGKLDLDRILEERNTINTNIVKVLDEASDDWGVKVLRYEIKETILPKDVHEAMEKQMRAEREKRATILTAQGERQKAIDLSEGEKTALINRAEGTRQDMMLRAQGEAAAIKSVAEATAEGIRQVALSLKEEGGSEAMSLRIAEQYIEAFKGIAKTGNTIVVPANLTDLAGMIAAAKGSMALGNGGAQPPSAK